MEIPLLLVRTWNSSYGIHFRMKTGEKTTNQPTKHPLAINHSPLANFHALKIKRRGNKSWSSGLLSCEEIPPWWSQAAGPVSSKEQTKMHQLPDSLWNYTHDLAQHSKWCLSNPMHKLCGENLENRSLICICLKSQVSGHEKAHCNAPSSDLNGKLKLLLPCKVLQCQ